MPSLAELQYDFAAALAGRGGPPGLAIYRANTRQNWAGALAGAYPIVRKIVGERFFDALCAEYARQRPSVSGDLNEYGAALAQFVDAFAGTRDLPYLPDVARMEWLAHRAYYAADPIRFDPSRLSQDDAENWRLRLAPACALLASPWPLGRLWTVHQDDFDGDVDVDLEAGPDRVLVHRPAWRVRVCSLADGDYRFLAAAGTGATLGDALEAAAADRSFDARPALAHWVEAGAIML